MIFIGIDIGKSTHYANAVDSTGNEIATPFPFPNSLPGFQTLKDFILSFHPLDSLCVAMEATGHYWLNLYTFLFDLGLETHVFNPIQTEAVRRMNIRKTKTDSLDCRFIADVVRFGNYSDIRPQSSDIQQLRQLCRFRYGMADELGALKNQVIGLLDRVFPEYSSLFSDVFGVTSLALLAKYTLPEEFLKVPTSRLAAVLAKHSRGRFGEAKALEIKEACKRSVGIKGPTSVLSFQLRSIIDHIAFVDNQISQIEGKIDEIYSRCNCFLHTIQGVGSLSAAVILSEIGNIDNFESPRKVVAFAGLDPSIHQSGNFQSTHNSMSKRGSPYLRRAIWSCAVVAARCNPVLSAFYQKKRSEGKNHLTAIGGVAHKLCGPIFAVLRDRSPYVPLA